VKFGNQFIWEINIDPSNIKKTETSSLQKLIINSQFFIINNFGFFGNESDHLQKTNKYQIYIIRHVKEVSYILRVKEVNFLVSMGGSE
jgi:hypothetical protein